MTKKHIPKLNYEILQDKVNRLYLSLIEYKRESFLTVIDNITDSEIHAYVLDYAQQEEIDLDDLFTQINRWYYSKQEQMPLSVYFSTSGLSEAVSPILKIFDLGFVSRIIGCPFQYALTPRRIRRRRIIPVPASVEIKLTSR